MDRRGSRAVVLMGWEHLPCGLTGLRGQRCQRWGAMGPPAVPAGAAPTEANAPPCPPPVRHNDYQRDGEGELDMCGLLKTKKKTFSHCFCLCGSQIPARHAHGLPLHTRAAADTERQGARTGSKDREQAGPWRASGLEPQLRLSLHRDAVRDGLETQLVLAAACLLVRLDMGN